MTKGPVTIEFSDKIVKLIIRVPKTEFVLKTESWTYVNENHAQLRWEISLSNNEENNVSSSIG